MVQNLSTYMRVATVLLSHSHTHTHTHIISFSPSLSFHFLSLSYIHTLSRTVTQMSYFHSPSLSFQITHSLTLTHTHSHSLTLPTFFAKNYRLSNAYRYYLPRMHTNTLSITNLDLCDWRERERQESEKVWEKEDEGEIWKYFLLL